MRMIYRLAAATAFLTISAFGAAMPAAAQTDADRNGATGRTVIQADFEQGRFERQANGGWVELDDHGAPAFRFRETGRDDWSVYLTEIGSDKQVQIDLYRMMISVSQGGGPRNDLYPIINARAPGPVRIGRPISPTPAPAPGLALGMTLKRATYDGGYFVQGIGTAWTEYQGDRAVYHFREISRTANAVTLLDASRGTRIELNLPRGMIRVSWSNGSPFEDLYPISGTVNHVDNDRAASGALPAGPIRPQPGYVDYGLQYNFKIEAGPITTQQEASRKCPALASRLGGSWEQGWERRDGVKSVCVVRFER